MVGDAGRMVSLEHFGASAAYQRLYEEFGITPRAVAEAARDSIRAAAGPVRPGGSGPARRADRRRYGRRRLDPARGGSGDIDQCPRADEPPRPLPATRYPRRSSLACTAMSGKSVTTASTPCP